VARLSSAAYLYREASTDWHVVVKYHGVKTGDDAHRHAQREWDAIREARRAGLTGDDARALRPWGLWRGAILLEYVDGLTLHDTIAVRKSQPGLVVPRLCATARLLATFHSQASRPEVLADFGPAVDYAHKVVDNLGRWGVLQQRSSVVGALRALVDGWMGRPEMAAFVPTLVHGDATTTNFLFPRSGGVVGIDWERLHVADPASDVGRLMAEVWHAVERFGGDATEAESFAGDVWEAYGGAMPPGSDVEAARTRARFYRASSMLRIARNGWLSRLDRTALVAEAMALLVQPVT
jgi:aminoglycoside phosphotransferase (APT) family kinase protein